MHLHSMLKSKSQIRHLLISQELFYLNQVSRNNFGSSSISMIYGPPSIMIIGCVVMFLTYFGMEQDLHTNISKYGVWESTSSTGVLQERSLMIYNIVVISWDIQLLQ